MLLSAHADNKISCRDRWLKPHLCGAAVNDKLHGGFHWFELYLGIALALLLLACAGMLAWEWRERKRKRDEFRTATNLEFNVEPRYLARLLGEVGPF